MKIRLLLSVGAVLLFLQTAQAQVDIIDVSHGKTIVGDTFYGDRVYHYKITAQDLVNAPSWNPEMSDPPVSINNAVKIARTNLKRLVKEGAVWDLDNVTLEQMSGGKWLYVVFFNCWNDNCHIDRTRDLTIYVKMDGSIVEPEKRPRTDTSAP